MNLPLCLWLNSIHPAELIAMFHEVAFPVRRDQPLQYNVLGVVTTLMARLVARAATRIIVASERWQTMLNRLGATAPISWLPVPSTIPVVNNAAETLKWRARYTRTGGLLIGHFANYSDYSVGRLSQVIPGLLSSNRGLSFLLLGANSKELRRHLLQRYQHLEGSIHASGALARQDLSSALSACDVMLQPYPDGVSTRRSSTSALMAHGRAVVTTAGIATEPLWMNGDAVAMAPASDANRLREVTSQMLSSAELRDRYARGALKLYDRRFALRHTIAELIDDSPIRGEQPASAYRGSIPGSSSASSLR
jgi:glycosyltransferase involved in cell wall biosynthesis